MTEDSFFSLDSFRRLIHLHRVSAEGSAGQPLDSKRSLGLEPVEMTRREAGLAIALMATGFASTPLIAPSDAAVPAAPRPPVVTRHSGIFNGQSIRYTATVEPIDVPDAQGKPSARIVSFAYTADELANPATRPVIFAFNGGPITASLWLHIGIMGPKRVAMPEDLAASPATYRLVDNSYSPLDTADIVCFDPASTGFSRVLPGTNPESYYSVAADGQQTTAFISAWLAQHKRLSSPVYILGESYGTMRAAEVAGQLTKLSRPILLAGVILLGQAVNIIEYSQRPQNIISYVVSLPTLAALAWYHRKVDRKGKTVEEFAREAWRFAQRDYLTTLFQGSDIHPADRNQVAQRLEELSGIPAAYYREHDLRITKEQFRAELLKERMLLLGRNDGRYVAPMTDKGLAADPSAIVMAAFERLFNGYLRDHLKVDWSETYVAAAKVGGLNGWGWGGTTPFSTFDYSNGLLKMMEANPRFRVRAAEGYYDTETTPGSAIYLVRDAGWPKGRASLAFYEGGHAVYMAEPAGRKFASDLRAFVQTS